MSFFDRLTEAESTTVTRDAIPKGNYQATVESAVLQEHPVYGKNINWAFRLHGQLEGRKVFSTNYLEQREGQAKDPIWKLMKNLKGLGLTRDTYPKSIDELLPVLEAAVDQRVMLEVTRYKTQDGKDKNDVFILALDSGNPSDEEDVKF